MPVLKLLKGHESWKKFELEDLPVLIGRDARECRAVLKDQTISRKHAEVTREGDRYYIRNLGKAGTILNGRRLDGDTAHVLKDGDLIHMCDYMLTFLLDGSGRDDSEDSVIFDDDEGSSAFSSILKSSSSSWALRKGINPEAKLTAIMELTQELRSCDSLAELLGRALTCLLKLFPQAYRGLVVLTTETDEPSARRVVRYRAGQEEESAHISEALIKDVVERQAAVLAEHARMICTPLINVAEHAQGVIRLDSLGGAEKFNRDDLDLLATVADVVSYAVENSILHEMEVRERALQVELQVATEVQLGLLPAAPPRIDGYDFFDYYSPARHVGGDYYDYIPAPGERLSLVLGDVVGKGIPAALLMAKVSSELAVYLSTHSPADAIASVRERFLDRSPDGKFVTMVVASLDYATHQVTLANAGHPPVIIRHPDGTITEPSLDMSGRPLGIRGDAAYPELCQSLAPGEAILLYSDGVLDATSVAGDRYGVARLKETVTNAGPCASDIGNAVMADVAAFVGDGPQFDDVCLLCFSRDAD